MIHLTNTFVESINQLMPHASAQELLHAIAMEPSVTAVRLNTGKGSAITLDRQRVPWCEWGMYLAERPQFTFDPHFHGGRYYVQDASSMFVVHVIKSLVRHPVKYLDLCAAPGGKTTAALQALPQGSMVIANEIVPQRAQVLRENVVKWGADNCMVTCDNPRVLGAATASLDVIAADVPCSGEGMFRKDADAVAQWSPALVEQCARRQREIVSAVWPALKPGGLMIYSTCTYNVHENEEIVDFIASELGATMVEVPTSREWNIMPAMGRDYPCYRFMPHMTRGEGLTLYVLRKNRDAATPPPSERRRDKKSAHTSSPTIPAEMKKWLDGDYHIIETNDIVTATPTYIKQYLATLPNTLHTIKKPGIELGIVKGKKIVPSHQLAMAANLATDSFASVDVDYRTAIAYLRGEAIAIDAPRGYVMIRHEGSALGWVNNLGARANNLYPKPWRIMSTHVPTSHTSVLEQVKSSK